MSVNTIYRNAGYVDKTVVFRHAGQNLPVEILVPGNSSSEAIVEHAWDTIDSITVAPAVVNNSGLTVRKVTLAHGGESLTIKVDVRSDFATDDEAAIENAYAYIGARVQSRTGAGKN